MRRIVLLSLALAACKSPTPTESDPPDDTDVEVPLTVPDTTRLSALDADEAGEVCGVLEGVAPVTLDCDGFSLVYADAAIPACPTDLVDVEGSCMLTVGDLIACLDTIPTATCDTDFSEDPCRALHAPGCAPLDAIASALLGGPYGLQDAQPLGQLTNSQQFAFCLETTGFEPVTLDCDGEFTVEPATQAECAGSLSDIPPGCTATLGDSRACIDALQAGDCDALFGTSGPCAAVADPSCQP